MREKSLWLIVTFPTTTGAMAAEALCRDLGLEGRLIPVPREITAGCGMAWRAPPDAREALELRFSRAGLETDGWHELFL